MASEKNFEQALLERGFLSEAQLDLLKSLKAESEELKDLALEQGLLSRAQVDEIEESLGHMPAAHVDTMPLIEDGAGFLPKLPGPAQGPEGTRISAPPSADDFAAPSGASSAPEAGGLQASGGAQAAVLPKLPTAQDSASSSSSLDQHPAMANPRVQEVMKAMEKAQFDESMAETLAPGVLPQAEVSDDTSSGAAQLRTDTEDFEELPEAAPTTQPATLPRLDGGTPAPTSDAFSCPHCGHQEAKKPSMLCPKCRAYVKKIPKNDKLTGKVLGDRFTLNGRLGAGGMGLVYHATDQESGAFVACKILPIQLSTDESTIQRFNLEARVMLELDHPNIVKALDYGFAEDVGCYLAMELLIGEEFKDYLERDRILSPQKIRKIYDQLCKAMGYAHSQGVVHRDLKPSNLFLMQVDGGDPLGLVKVIDFGIARLTADDMPRHTVTGTFLGTPQYMSPEQAAALGELDHRSDIYTLGIILFEVLTGRIPFVGNHIAQVMMNQIYMQPPRLEEIRPEIAYPSALQTFMDAVLAKEPEGRPASVEDFHKELTEALKEFGGGKDEWEEATSQLASKPDEEQIVTERLLKAANTMLSHNQLPTFGEQLQPQELFEELARMLRTPRQQVPTVGEVAVLMLSEEVGEDSLVEEESRSYSSIPGLPAVEPAAATTAGRSPEAGRSRRAPRALNAKEQELLAAQKRKLAFMFVFALLFFGLLVVVLWIAK